MDEHPPTMDEVLAKARETSNAYDRILREVPPAGSGASWHVGRDYRLRVAADGMRMVLAALMRIGEEESATPV